METDIKDKPSEAKWINAELPVVVALPTEVGDLDPLFSAGQRGWAATVRLLFDASVGSSDFAFYIGQGSVLRKVAAGTITGVGPGKHATLTFFVPPNFDLFGVCMLGPVLTVTKLLPE